MMDAGTTGLPPLALYVHLPWCVRKCPYCDFNSHGAGTEAPTDGYVDALLRDLGAEASSGRALGRRLESVFFGGGTPSLFSGAQIGRILDAVRRDFSLDDAAEISLEANPGTVECAAPAEYRAAGVNRLSLGAQSFDERMLQRLGRIHGPAEITAAYRSAAAAGFESINLDLMFALPGQDLPMAIADLEQAVELEPPHLSWYQLTLEPNTVFFARPPPDLPDEDAAFAIGEAGRALLCEAGYEHYEVSAFAREGHRCRHNSNYWSFGDYLAVGAGGHGKVTDADGSITRYAKPAHPLSYMEQAGSPVAGTASRVLGEAEVVFEYMLNALRLAEGFTERAFSARTGLPFERVAARVQQAREEGLLAATGDGRWRPTLLGQRFLNDLQAKFLPTG